MRLIDADELRKKFYNYTTESGIHVALDRYAVSCVDNAPTVSPDMAQVLAYECGKAERKRGMWHYCDTMYYCDSCGSGFYEMSAFCPNCGADMRGEANEDTDKQKI